MAKPRREQFRCQSDAIAPLLETSQFLRVLRLDSGSIDRCSWLFQWPRILFVVATEVRQESLLIQRETWQQKLYAGVLAEPRHHSRLRPDRRQRRALFQRLEKIFHTCLANGNKNASVMRQLLQIFQEPL